MTPNCREPQWRDQPYWERDNVQELDPRREKVGAVEQDGGSKKKEEGDRLSGIYNLSSIELTHKETNILHLGQKCGLKRPISKFDVYVDVHKYMRKLNMKKYFLNKNFILAITSTNTSVAIDRRL